MCLCMFSHSTRLLVSLISHTINQKKEIICVFIGMKITLRASSKCVSLFRDNDITGVLDHTFCVEHNAYGEIIQHELKPNGKSIPVTQDTKKEYVRLYVNWRFLRGIEAQFLALQKGFNEVIPQHLLKAFDEKELEVLC